MIMTLYPKLIHDALATVRYPGNGKNLIDSEIARRWHESQLLPHLREVYDPS